MFRNTELAYGFIAKFFHWIMALLFVLMFIVAYIMINIPRSHLMFTLYDFHKATGLLLFTLVLLRLIWININPRPKLPNNISKLQKKFADWNIYLLYFLMITMPISGFLTSTLSNHSITFYYLFTLQPLGNNSNTSEFFSNVHEYLAYLLLIAFSLHVIAALYHNYILRDNVLKRMWFNRRFYD